MRLPPPDVIASWPPPNYEHPVRRGPAMLIVQLTILPIALLTLVLRMYVRLFVVRRCQLDDWLMCAAMVFGIGVTVCVILACQIYGWDVHVWDLKPHQLAQGRQASIAAQTMFLFASGLVKLSILVSYLRIAPLDSWFRRLTHWAIALVVALIPIFQVVLWTQCRAQTTLSVISDFIVYVLPLPTLISVRLPTFQRMVLLAVFSLGFIVVLAGCFRTYWIYEVVISTYDVTWHGYTLWIWVAVEVNSGVICGCVPTLRPLFQTQRKTSSGGGTGGNSRGRTQSLPQQGTADGTRSRNSGHGVESIEGTFRRLRHVLGRKLRRPRAKSESLYSGDGDVELSRGKTAALEGNVDSVQASPGPWAGSDLTDINTYR